MSEGERWRGAAWPAALVLSAATAGLTGCGQTGPLYLPDDASTTVITRPGPVTTDPAATRPSATDAPTVDDAAATPPAPGAAGAPATATDKPPARR